MVLSVRAKYILLASTAASTVAACLIIALAIANTYIRPVVLLTGDSHTQQGTNPANSGWVALLQNQYVMNLDVVTRGLPDYNTKWFTSSSFQPIEREIQKGIYHTPSLITVWFGSNDAALANGTSSKTHVSLEDYKENLKTIVRQLWIAEPTTDILLITPPHINDSARAELILVDEQLRDKITNEFPELKTT